jgi:hypothetical protein
MEPDARKTRIVMKHAFAPPALLVALAVGLAGCSGGKQAEQPTQPTLHEVMKNEIDANADKLWDVTNSALGEKAQLDASKMTDDQWNQLADLANKVKDGANKLANMNPIVATKPGVKIADEDVPFGDSAASVQANIDKDPEQLHEFAGVLAQDMADLATAAKAHDAAKAGPIIDQLDGVCEDCHLQFWYPSQKDLVEKFRKEGVTPPKK